MAFLAGFTSMIHGGNHRDNISTEQDIESGQKDSPSISIRDVSYGDPSREQIERKKDELQTLI